MVMKTLAGVLVLGIVVVAQNAPAPADPNATNLGTDANGNQLRRALRTAALSTLALGPASCPRRTRLWHSDPLGSGGAWRWW